MRLKKLKAARKTLAFFRVHFKLRPPYKLVMDGCFLHNAHKMDFQDQIAKLLQAEVTIYLTHCVLHELQQLGDKVASTLEAAKHLHVLKCGHKASPLSAAECICKQVVGNANSKKYIVASTDTELMGRLREVAGLPLLYMDRSVLVLEAPSPISQDRALKAEKQKTAPSKAERRMLQASISGRPVKTKAAVEPSEASSESQEVHSAAPAVDEEPQPQAQKPKPKRKKGPKGVNPLAMKKKKKKSGGEQSGSATDGGAPSKKRRRRKKKSSAPENQ